MGQIVDQIQAEADYAESEYKDCGYEDPEYTLEQNARLLRENHMRDPAGAESTGRGIFHAR